METPRPINPQYDDEGKGDAGIVPDLSKRTVVAVFDGADGAGGGAAQAAAAALRQRGVAEEDISLVRRGEETPPAASADDTKAGAGTAAGVSAGAVIGGALGLAALAVPGVGPLLAAGPIAAALGGAIAGGAVGGLIGSFAGLGVPTEEAETYERAVRAGAIVLAVKAPDEETADAYTRLLQENGATQVNSYQPSL
jgi:hypothetical protein